MLEIIYCVFGWLWCLWFAGEIQVGDLASYGGFTLFSGNYFMIADFAWAYYPCMEEDRSARR